MGVWAAIPILFCSAAFQAMAAPGRSRVQFLAHSDVAVLPSASGALSLLPAAFQGPSSSALEV